MKVYNSWDEKRAKYRGESYAVANGLLSSRTLEELELHLQDWGDNVAIVLTSNGYGYEVIWDLKKPVHPFWMTFSMGGGHCYGRGDFKFDLPQPNHPSSWWCGEDALNSWEKTNELN